MGDTTQRYQQDGHGFVKLAPVKRDAAGWRRAVIGEAPDAIVARVFGPSAFAVVTSGEIDGLDGFTAGQTLGVTLTGPIAVGGSPIVAKAVSKTNVLVSIQSLSSGSTATAVNTSLVALSAAVTQNANDVTALYAANLLSEKLINKGASNGYAPLVSGKIPSSYLTTDDLPVRRAWMGV